MIAEVPESSYSQSPLSNLMTMVAKRHLGEVGAIVIATLMSHGRLTAKDISKRSQVPLKLVKTTLVSLIQLNCALYWQELLGTSSSGKIEYQFHDTGLMTFLHSGEIITLINDNYDDNTTQIIQNLIQIGNVKVLDFLKNFDGDLRYEMDKALAKLHDDGWIRILQPHDFNPIEDLWNKIYQETLKQTPRSATVSEVKRTAEVKEASKIKLSNLLDNLPSDIHRREHGEKFLNLNLQISFNYRRFEKHLRSKALVSLCESRIGLISANILGTALKLMEKNSPDVNHYLTKIDGIITDPSDLKMFHEAIEAKLVDNKSITFKCFEVSKRLDKNLDLRNSILTHNFLKPNNQNKKKRVSSFSDIEKSLKRPKIEKEKALGNLDEDEESNEINTLQNNDFVKEDEEDQEDEEEYEDINGDTDNSSAHSVSLVNHHLKLLSSATSIPFIMELGPGTFTIPYYKLLEIVKEYNYDELIKKTLGSESLRVLRCIKHLKLVDEKTIANAVLLKDKVVRNEIYKLIQLNVIEIQEIPRSNDRAASKTFFAFRYNKANSYSFLKNSLVHNMANILHVIEQFKSENKVLLEKCEREDVKGNESELLLESELRTLNALKFREANNIGKLNRLLSLYDIF